MNLPAESISEVNTAKFTLQEHVHRNLHVQIPSSDI